MLIHLDKYGLDMVFVHPPRSSGTSIEHCILKSTNGQPPYQVPDEAKHLRASQIKNQIGLKRWDQAYKFGIVRNPFDILASLYITPEPNYCIHNSNSGRTMAQFLSCLRFDAHRDDATIPMKWEHGTTCSQYMDEDLDYIIKYETRLQGLSEVNQQLAKYKIKIDSSQVRRNHTNKKKNFMEYYDSESIQIVQRLFKRDLQRWYNDYAEM